MTRRSPHLRYSFLVISLVTLAGMAVGRAAACPVCFGEPGSGTTHGLQAAIAVLGGTTLLAIGAIAVVVMRIRARAAANGRLPASGRQPMDESIR